jgi:hypothetical protein
MEALGISKITEISGGFLGSLRVSVIKILEFGARAK